MDAGDVFRQGLGSVIPRPPVNFQHHSPPRKQPNHQRDDVSESDSSSHRIAHTLTACSRCRQVRSPLPLLLQHHIASLSHCQLPCSACLGICRTHALLFHMDSTDPVVALFDSGKHDATQPCHDVSPVRGPDPHASTGIQRRERRSAVSMS